MEVYQQGMAPFDLLDKHLLTQSFIGDITTSKGQMVLRGGMVVDMPMPEPVLSTSPRSFALDKASGAGYEMGNYEYMLNELVGVDEAMKLITSLESNEPPSTKRRAQASSA